MDIQGKRTLAATRQQAWDALNDPAVLVRCIPGCERLEATGDNEFTALLALKIGPMSARFSGRVVLSDIQAPHSYRLGFEGQGGAAGFGKGSSQVQLAPDADGDGCVLSYTAHAQVGGKIAQMGQRLIDGVARRMSDEFFNRFEQALAAARHPQASLGAGPDALPAATP